MVNNNRVIEKDLKHIWHPCSQMKDFEQCPPLIVTGAKGCYLETNKGPIIDAVSSWWCKALGHGHPGIISAINEQLSRFEHVISANTTHEVVAELGEKLATITNNQHQFFASDGSCAVEIALKLTLQANQLRNTPEKNRFAALKNSYHGETLATLSVSDLGLYKKPFESFGLRCDFLQDVPYVHGQEDANWNDCEAIWASTLKQLEPIKDTLCALLVEPILQGAGGMICYSADFLRRLADYCKKHGIYLIADEIMTGLGRTGAWLACNHANVQPDIVCLSKGLTSGTIPFSCVSVSDEIYQLFYDDYESRKAFMHSHTYSGNALGASAALATLNAMSQENIPSQAQHIGGIMRKKFIEIAEATGKISNIRGIGAVIAGDLEPIKNRRMGFEVYQHGLSYGALLRPLGNTLYWFPPLNVDERIIGNLAQITLNSIYAAYQ